MIPHREKSNITQGFLEFRYYKGLITTFCQQGLTIINLIINTAIYINKLTNNV